MLLLASHFCRAGLFDTSVGTSDTPTLSEADPGVGVECRKSGVKSVSQLSRGVGRPVLSSDTSTLFEKWRRHFTFEMEMSSSYDRVFFVFLGNLPGISNCSAALYKNWLNYPTQSSHKLSLCQLCLHHSCGPRDSFSSRNPWRKRRSRVGTSMFNKCWNWYLIIIFQDVHGSCLTRVDRSFLLRFKLAFKKYGTFSQFGPWKLTLFLLAFCFF